VAGGRVEEDLASGARAGQKRGVDGGEGWE